MKYTAQHFIDHGLDIPDLYWAFSEGSLSLRITEVNVHGKTTLQTKSLDQYDIHERVARFAYETVTEYEYGLLPESTYFTEAAQLKRQLNDYIHNTQDQVTINYAVEFISDVTTLIYNQIALMLLCNQLVNFPFTDGGSCTSVTVTLTGARVTIENDMEDTAYFNVAYCHDTDYQTFKQDRLSDCTLNISSTMMDRPMYISAADIPRVIQEHLSGY